MRDTQKQCTGAGICHFDIAGTDSAALGAFYQSVFGWQIDKKGPGYSQVKTPVGGPNGAIVESEATGVTLGITVENLEITLNEILAAGGEITMPVTDNGWVKKAQFKDIDGNIMTILEG